MRANQVLRVEISGMEKFWGPDRAQIGPWEGERTGIGSEREWEASEGGKGGRGRAYGHNYVRKLTPVFFRTKTLSRTKKTRKWRFLHEKKRKKKKNTLDCVVTKFMSYLGMAKTSTTSHHQKQPVFCQKKEKRKKKIGILPEKKKRKKKPTKFP